MTQIDKKRRVQPFGRTIGIIILIIFIVTTGIVAGSALYINSALKPVDVKANETIDVSIPIGSSVQEIANTLESNGAIKSALVFRYYVKFNNETGFQAGNYKLTTAMDMQEVITKLKEGPSFEDAAVTITIPEGYKITEIIDVIARETEYSQEQIEKQLQDPEFIETLASKYPMLNLDDIRQDGIKYALEGYLFPATYSFHEKNPPLETIISDMVEKMQSVLNQYTDEIKENGYTIHEIITLASLIETETQKSDDRYKVSGVFHNRLENGMRLDSDPTVKYALDKTDIQVTYRDTDVSSPYNTYRMIGIPIGPIASPREESIKAALQPQEVDEFYFFARPNGQVIYTKTLDEHEKVVTTYRHEWNELIESQQKVNEE